MANFDINNFVIDRIIRGVALSHSDNSVLFSINQIQNASLNCSSESTDAVDAMGAPITTFYRAKNAEFSAENALFDMGLMAAQLGTEKKVAGDTTKIIAPAMETIEIKAGQSAYELKHTPVMIADKDGNEVNSVKEIYALNGDSTFGTKYAVGTSASANEFVIDGNSITVPTGLAAGTELFVMYDYESTEAVEVVNSAKAFPTNCKFVMEVLGCDVCDTSNLVYAYVVFNNAKLSPDFDWSIATDGTHPFSMRAQQDYCDKEKKLFSIIIPGDQDSDE